MPAGMAMAAHDAGPDRLDVDRLVDRLPDPHVGEGIPALDVRGAKLRAALIEPEEDRPELHRLLEPARRACLRAGRAQRTAGSCRKSISPPSRAAIRCSGSATAVNYDPVDVVRVLRQAPPVRVPHQHHARARLVVLQHERAGAIRVVLDIGDLGIGVRRHLDRAMPLRPGLGHDRDRRTARPADRVRPIVRTRTTWSPLPRQPRSSALRGELGFGDSARRRLKTTSSAVISVPSWKRTPWRSSNSQVVGSIRRQATARPGLMLWSS